jgi:pimeloyl-ACP methyl ester carboxylesterase
MPFAAILRRPASAETTASCKSFLQANAQLAGSPRRASARLQSVVQKLCSGDEIAVLVRGTATASDWGYNFDMALTANSEYGSGKIHRGFQSLANTLWTDGLRQVLDEVKAGASRITFAGHSLGASTAALLAARSQVRPIAHWPLPGL